MSDTHPPIDTIIVAVPETAGSALYGMLHVLLATGNVWQTLVGDEPPEQLFRVRVLSPTIEPFTCGHGIPVKPDLAVTDDPRPEILILPELWLGPDEPLTGRYPEIMEWICRCHASGSRIYSACSGAVMLAETGLLNLNNCEATSHWAYRDLFRTCYPSVRFKPEPNLVFADPKGQIVTAGGTTSWHDLAIHIISRHASRGEALRITKVYLLKWHSEGQLPYAKLVRRQPHADAVVRRVENWLATEFRRHGVLSDVVKIAKLPERTLKRRFKNATGTTLIDYVQNVRVEEAKRQLETSNAVIDEISESVGYEDPSFFRQVFKRRTGLSPSQYRRMFTYADNEKRTST